MDEKKVPPMTIEFHEWNEWKDVHAKLHEAMRVLRAVATWIAYAYKKYDIVASIFDALDRLQTVDELGIHPELREADRNAGED